MTTDIVRIADYDLEEPLTVEMVAETTGARVSLVARLVEVGILETINERATADDPVLLPRRAVLRLRQMQRLRRDLGVNFAGASVILELVDRMEEMKREIARMRPTTASGR
jgi:chaperone modulatory protein CbpM